MIVSILQFIYVYLSHTDTFRKVANGTAKVTIHYVRACLPNAIANRIDSIPR